MDHSLTWYKMPIGEQISNVGSEVHRAIRWKNKGDEQKKINFCKKAIAFLEIMESDPKNKHRKGELDSCIDELEDYFLGENIYQTTDDVLIKFYDAFL